MKFLAHGACVNDVVEGNNGHSLVMSHIRAHNRDLLAFRQARTRVVEGLVKSIRALASSPCEAFEISDRSYRFDHRGKRGGIRGYHQVLIEAPLQSKSWHTKTRVVIDQVNGSR